jgi:hypothetical protein
LLKVVLFISYLAQPLIEVVYMSFDLNADNYSRLELLGVLQLPPTATSVDIIAEVEPYINKYTAEKNAPVLSFFVRMKDILLNQSGMSLLDPEPITDSADEPTQNKSDNSYTIPIKKDILNPNLKNTVTRLIHLDSQFRQSTATGNSSTDYTLDLSDPLKNVLSLRLYSIQIPFSWYIVDPAYNNHTFWFTMTDQTNRQVIMDAGNYTPATFVDALNMSILAVVPDISGVPVAYSQSTGKLTFRLQTTTGPAIETVVFFDFEGILITAPYVNSTLGWLMGFRESTITVATINVADGVLDLYGTKNLLLVIDDYNQNHVNNGLVSITETSNTLSLPSYYRPDLPFTVQPPINEYNTNIEDFGDSAFRTFKQLPIMQPTSPRILTQSQIYTVNEIMKNRERTMTYRMRAPTSPDIFAMIPMKHGGMKIGDVYVEFGSSLQTNMRVYFGPVNIERIRIRLLDDKGNIINLNGIDWSVTLISENLYQY